MRSVFATTLVLAVLGACSAETEPTVRMVDARMFEPARLTIEVGDSVMWRNESDEPHSVTALGSSIFPGARYFSSGGFDSEEEARDEVAAGLIAPGDALSVGFDSPGTYEYFCIPHEDQGMKGTIVVEG